jgi:flagellar hook-associated protein 2
MTRLLLILVCGWLVLPANAQVPSSEQVLGHGVGNGGDEIRRVFIETGFSVLDYLSSTTEGKAIVSRYSLDLDRLSAQLTIQKIKVGRAKEDLDLDNGGSRIDSVLKDDKLWLIQERWDKYIQERHPLNRHVFHEMLRLAEYDDDDYVISSKLNELNFKTLPKVPLSKKRDPKELQALQLRLEQEVAAYSTIKSLLDSLKTNVSAFQYVGDFKVKMVQSSDPSVVTATASTQASTQSFSLLVESLATNEVWRAAFQSLETSVTSADASFTLKVQGAKKVMQIAAGTSLIDFAAQINSANFGVTAQIYDTGEGAVKPARLILLSNTPGKHGHFEATSSLTELKTEDFQVAVPAQDSKIIFNNESIFRKSNTVSDLVRGVTLTLLSADPGAVKTITISEDDSPAISKMKDFVTKYNAVVSGLKTAISFSTQFQQGNITASDPLLTDILWLLSTSVTDMIPTLAENKIRSLVDLGIRGSSVGSAQTHLLELDELKFNAVFNSSSKEVQIFFEGKDIDHPGFAKNFGDLLKSLTDYGGRLPTRISNHTMQISQISNELSKDERKMK